MQAEEIKEASNEANVENVSRSYSKVSPSKQKNVEAHECAASERISMKAQRMSMNIVNVLLTNAIFINEENTLILVQCS